MAISPSLKQFVSSGVYRLTFDKSQTISVPSQTTRLVIGFSKKGVFNTPLYCADTDFFTSVYGDRDTSLERKGSFFHRTALTCLTKGPIIALNLLNLDDNIDKSQFQSISSSSTEANSPAVLAPVSGFFNKDKFWYANAEALQDTAANSDYQSVANQKLITIANIGRKQLSVIIRKSDAIGFDITAKEWYGNGKVPVFLNENDYISDYMIDVIVLDGDYSNYTSLSIDPIFGPYFDNNGLKKIYIDAYGNQKDGLVSFLNLPQVSIAGVYTGCLIPETSDKVGNNLFIEDIVNLETPKTGLLISINKSVFDEQPVTFAGKQRFLSGDLIDLVGHSMNSKQPTSVNFLSYSGSIVETISYMKYSSAANNTMSFIVSGTSGVAANGLLRSSAAMQSANGYVPGCYDTLTVYGPSADKPAGYVSAFATVSDFENWVNTLQIGKTYLPTVAVGVTSTVNYSEIVTKTYDATGQTVLLGIKLALDANSGIAGPVNSLVDGFYKIDAISSGSTGSLKVISDMNWIIGASGNNYVFAGPDSDLFADYQSGLITDGDKIVTGAAGDSTSIVSFTKTFTNDLFGVIGSGLTNVKLNKKINYVTLNALSGNLNGGVVLIKTLTGDINEKFKVSSNLTPANPTNIVWLDNTPNGPFGQDGFTGRLVKGQYLVVNFGGTGATSISPINGKSRLTKITSVINDTNPLSPTYGFIKVTTNEPIYVDSNWEIQRYKDIKDFAQNYTFFNLNGYTLRDAQIPNGTLDRQNEILDVMYNTNIAQALTDREIISFRYIVDSFEGTIERSSKSRLTTLAKNRGSVFAILNMPSVKQFKESVNPLFKANSTSLFNTYYIAQGGNLDLNPSNVFSLPTIDEGSNYGAWYGPNLIIREAGTNVSIPPAAHVSNLFIEKNNQGNPYAIIAGPRRGVVSGNGLAGVEYNFDKQDLDYIEPFGYNAIVNKKGFGLVINANQTGQQNVQSALSQAHVRELLIYIQDQIEGILKNYRWEYNTAQVRLEIKTLADNFMAQVLSDGGVYSYSNVMDTTNNTNEIIQAHYGILDTYIEPVQGLGILVHRTTILKTGQISTGLY
jgi:hypothetical protein